MLCIEEHEHIIILYGFLTYHFIPTFYSAKTLAYVGERELKTKPFPMKILSTKIGEERHFYY